jgi:hypothetical protein
MWWLKMWFIRRVILVNGCSEHVIRHVHVSLLLANGLHHVKLGAGSRVVQHTCSLWRV